VHQEKREDVDWLFHCLLTSLKEALHSAGPLFAFVPEFYVEACISAYSALKSYFTTSLLSPQSPGVLVVFTIPVTVGVLFKLSLEACIVLTSLYNFFL